MSIIRVHRRHDPPTWSGTPESAGWHWLRHRKHGEHRLGFWKPSAICWYVSDSKGRTRCLSEPQVALYFDYAAHVPEPTTPRV